MSEAPETTPVEPPVNTPSLADLYFVPGIIAVIAATAIVGAVVVLMLRKRS